MKGERPYYASAVIGAANDCARSALWRAEESGDGFAIMKISILELRTVAEFLDSDGVRHCRADERSMLVSVADYLRFVADQREEYESRHAPVDPRAAQLRAVLQKVWSGRAERLARRAG